VVQKESCGFESFLHGLAVAVLDIERVDARRQQAFCDDIVPVRIAKQRTHNKRHNRRSHIWLGYVRASVALNEKCSLNASLI
jgi:hypothetical protein